jgi:hypothetical protein
MEAGRPGLPHAHIKELRLPRLASTLPPPPQRHRRIRPGGEGHRLDDEATTSSRRAYSPGLDPLLDPA